MKEFWNKLPIKEKIKFILSVIAGILVVIFATLNWKDQEIHFIFKIIKVKLSIAILLSVIAGYIISFLFSYKTRLEKENEIEKLNKKIHKLTSDLQSKTEHTNMEVFSEEN
jgi:uncharacterized integral membrane protein